MSDHSVEIVWIFFLCKGYFASPQDDSNIPIKNNEMISTDDHHKLVLVFMPCYNIDLMLMSMFYPQI